MTTTRKPPLLVVKILELNGTLKEGLMCSASQLAALDAPEAKGLSPHRAPYWHP